MNWRLVQDGGAAGPWNMAVDEALLQGQALAGAQPVLRFYGWEPACLSLGRLQPWDEAYQRMGTEVVRRPTGGRAVWHQHEVTYSIAARLEQLPSRGNSVSEVYQVLNRGLLNGLAQLGVVVEAASGSGASKADRPANCFSTGATCDGAVDGKKLLGAAQLRQGGAVLQHGSLLLSLDRPLWATVLPGNSMEGAVALDELVPGLHRAQVEAALAAGLAATLGAELTPSQLIPAEVELATRLQVSRYRNPAWTRWRQANTAAQA